MDPAASQPDTAMAWPIQQLIPEQRANIPQHVRVAGRVKAVAAVVHAHSCELEAPGVAPAPTILFQHADLGQRAAGQLKRRTPPCRSRPQDDDVWLSHHSYRILKQAARSVIKSCQAFG